MRLPWSCLAPVLLPPPVPGTEPCPELAGLHARGQCSPLGRAAKSVARYHSGWQCPVWAVGVAGHSLCVDDGKLHLSQQVGLFLSLTVNVPEALLHPQALIVLLLG